MGYESSLAARLTVCLKSPQMRTDFLSLFSIGTIGAAQSANWIGLKTPLASSLSNSSFTSFRIAYGTCLGLQNTGLAFVSTCSVALCPFSVPRPS